MDDTENLPGFTPAPFPPLAGEPATTPEPPKNGRRKGRRGPRQPKPDPAKRRASKKQKRSRARANGASSAAAAATKSLELWSVVQACAGLTADEIKLVADVAQALAAWPEESRTRVASALGRMFP